jgi:hypothetical protein
MPGEGDTNNDNITQIRPATLGRESFTRNLPCTLGLVRISIWVSAASLSSFKATTLSLLTASEELHYKLELARDVLNSRTAEAHFAQSLLTEARATAGCRQAEIKLASLRAIEAERCVQYYCRLMEVASKNLTDAEMQYGVIRLESRKAGVALADEPNTGNQLVKGMAESLLQILSDADTDEGHDVVDFTVDTD